jgi:hypothetical protein
MDRYPIRPGRYEISCSYRVIGNELPYATFSRSGEENVFRVMNREYERRPVEGLWNGLAESEPATFSVVSRGIPEITVSTEDRRIRAGEPYPIECTVVNPTDEDLVLHGSFSVETFRRWKVHSRSTAARFHPDHPEEALAPDETYRFVLPPRVSHSFTVDPSKLEFTDVDGGGRSVPFHRVDVSTLRVAFVDEGGHTVFASNSLSRTFTHQISVSLSAKEKMKEKLLRRVPSFEIPEPTPLSVVLEDILGPQAAIDFVVFPEDDTDVTDIRMYDKTAREILERVLGPMGLEAKISGLNVVTAPAKTVTARYPLTQGEFGTLMGIFENPHQVKDQGASEILFGSLGAADDEQTVWLLPDEQCLVVADTKWNLGRVEEFLRESVYKPDGT